MKKTLSKFIGDRKLPVRLRDSLWTPDDAYVTILRKEGESYFGVEETGDTIYLPQDDESYWRWFPTQPRKK